MAKIPQEKQSFKYSYNLLADVTFNMSDKLILGFALTFKKRILFIAQDTLSNYLGLSKSTIYKSMENLENMNLIKYYSVDGKRYKYIMLTDRAITKYATYPFKEINNNVDWIKDYSIKEEVKSIVGINTELQALYNKVTA